MSHMQFKFNSFQNYFIDSLKFDTKYFDHVYMQLPPLNFTQIHQYSAGKWMELQKKIILSEVAQTPIVKYGMYLFTP